MGQQFLSKAAKLRMIALVLLVPILGGGAYLTRDLASDLSNLGNFESGLNTCFARINQSFTAGMIAQRSSSYLSKSFMETTEECLADVGAFVETQMKGNFREIQKKFNALASETHWFHEKLTQGGVENQSGATITTLAPSYKILEEMRDGILGFSSERRQKLENQLSRLKPALAIAIVIPFLFLFDLLSRRRKAKRNEDSEVQAKVIIDQNLQTSMGDIESIIATALRNNDLYYCGKLLDRLAGRKTEKVKIEIDNFEETATTIDTVSLNLSQFVEKSVDLLSAKLLGRGIIVDFEIDEKIYVQAESEALDQIFYNILIHSMKSIEATGARSGVVHFSAKALGNVVSLEVGHNGKGLSQNFLAMHTGLAGKGELSDVDPEIVICHEVIKDIGGNLDFTNIKRRGEVDGVLIKFYFRTGEAPKIDAPAIRVDQVIKGNKKDVLEKIRAQV